MSNNDGPAWQEASRPTEQSPPKAGELQRHVTLVDLLDLAKAILTYATTPPKEGGPLPRSQRKFHRLSQDSASVSMDTPPNAPAEAITLASPPPEITAPRLAVRPIAAPLINIDFTTAKPAKRRRSGELAVRKVSPAAERVEIVRTSNAKTLAWTWAILLIIGALTMGVIVGSLAYRGPPAASSSRDREMEKATVRSLPLPHELAEEPSPAITFAASPPETPANRAIAFLQAAEAAENRQDWPKALEFLEEAYRENPRKTGVRFRLAELSYRLGETKRADLWLQRSLDAKEEVAASYRLRGELSMLTNNYTRAIFSYEAAIRADPSGAPGYLGLGQSLRRLGKDQEAAQQFRLGIERAVDNDQREYLSYLWRLTQIESIDGADFAPELAAKLKLDPPPGDWLLTAAAQDLTAQQFPEAADLMRRAVDGKPAAYVKTRLDDFFFLQFTIHQEISDVYAQYLPKLVLGPKPSPAPAPDASATPPPIDLPPAAPPAPRP